MYKNLFASFNPIDVSRKSTTTEDINQDDSQDFYRYYIPQIIQEQENRLPSDIVSPDARIDNNQDYFQEDDYEEDEIQTGDNKPSIGENIVNTARQFLGRPYLWGGTNPSSGFDCSGLLQYVYAQNNIKIPRTADQMFKIGKQVNLDEVEPGDIICTPGTGSTGKHVKMVSRIDDDGQIYVIEAKGKQWGIVENPLTNFNNIITIRRIIQQTPESGKFNNHIEFIKTLNQEYQKALKNRGLDPNYSYILVAQDAEESGWGQHVAGDFNYGGIKSDSGKKKKTFEYINGTKTRVFDSFKNFNSIQDYCNYKIDLLSNDRYNAFSSVDANNPYQFIQHINDSGYSTTPSNIYVPRIFNIYKTVKRLS